MTIWFDVEDLYDHARTAGRPSGIQRLSYEAYAALHALAPERVGFVRTDLRRGTMHRVGWPDVAALFSSITTGEAEGPAHRRVPQAALMQSWLAKLPGVRPLAQRLPKPLRDPLREAARGQIGVLRHLGRAARAAPRALADGRRRAGSPASAAVTGPDLRELARPGDVLASFGSNWHLPDYAPLIQRAVRESQLRYAMLLYDMIPVVRPEYCDRSVVSVFGNYIRDCLVQADTVLTISEAAARDVRAWCAREGIVLRSEPRAIPIGTGFSHAAPAERLPAGLEHGGYALFVSTLELRKNHGLAFRAWRRLIEELPAGSVPKLVFAGRVGWLVADLLQQIENTGHLGGRLVFVEDPDDATLAALYRGARFTLFPSHYEGWGLPVSESLSFGKVCFASNASSVPEAGGDFCIYHDPDCVTEAAALYRRALTEPGLIAGLEQRIRDEYRPTPWSATARAVLDALG